MQIFLKSRNSCRFCPIYSPLPTIWLITVNKLYVKYLILYIIFFSFSIFQVSSFAKWIKCTKQNADKNISYKNVERNCDEGELNNPFPPKCDHTELFFDAPKGCWLSVTNVSYTYPWPYFQISSILHKK